MQNVIDAVSFDHTDINNDTHAASYADVVRDHGDACERLFAILRTPKVQFSMEMAEESFDLPPLAGALKALESDPKIATASKHLRFRQFVGDATRVLMTKRGWSVTRENGWVRSWSKNYTQARRFRKNGHTDHKSDRGDKVTTAFAATEHQ